MSYDSSKGFTNANVLEFAAALGLIFFPLPWLSGVVAAIVGPPLVAALADAFGDERSYEYKPNDCSFPPKHPFFIDPLVINLDGQGIKLTDASTSTAYFDFAGDGFRERTGWVAPGTGFVVLDKNGNGSIDNGSELFGGPAEDGLAALAKFDGDGNGRIDKKDAIFSQLRIWVDADGDAVTDAGELKTLAELGIRAILLNRETCGCEQFGNRFIVRGAFEYENGQTGQIAAIEFVTNPAYSIWTPPKGFALSTLAEKLPSLSGFGSLPYLQAAATLDPSLANRLRDFVLSADKMDVNTLRARFTEILFDWANVEGVDPASRGTLVDARKIAFLAKFYNDGFYDTANMGERPVALAADWTWDHVFDGLLSRLLRNVPESVTALTGDVNRFFESPFFAFLFVSDQVSFADAIGQAIDRLPSDPDVARNALDLFLAGASGFSYDYFNNDDAAMRKVVLETLASKVGLTIDGSAYNIGNVGDLISLFNNAKDPRGAIFALAAARAAGAEGYLGTSSADTVVGSALSDVIAGSKGNDMLRGGDGNDFYLWNRGDGHDTIDEGVWQGYGDVLHLGLGITQAQVSVIRVGADVRIVIASSSATAKDGGSILLRNQTGGFEKGIDAILFADGSVWNWAEIRTRALTVSGTSGNDSIIGSSIWDYTNDTIVAGGGKDSIQAGDGNDWLFGGTGNDLIAGGTGDDLYLWNRGHGHDTIDEGVWQGGGDVLQLGAGITQAQVSVIRVGADVRIVIAPSSATAKDGGSILILNQTGGTQRGIDAIVFADGSAWNWDDIRFRALTVSGTAGNDTIDGSSIADWTNDTITGGLGNDLMRGGAGDDRYVWNRGDGHDTIDEGEWQGGGDVLQLGAGITQAQVSVIRVGADVRIVIAPSSATAKDGGSILLRNQTGGTQRGIDAIVFADGSAWSFDDIRARALTVSGTAGNDTIDGSSIADWTNDTITGGLGNDLMRGGAGDDVYVWNRGAGNDRIDEGAWQGSDTLNLGVLWTSARVQKSGNDLLVTIEKSSPASIDGGSITVKDYFLGEMRGIDAIRWGDGSVWDKATIDFMSGCVWGTASNDTLQGTKGADGIIGQLGNDSIFGDDGNDSLVGGIGNDTLEGGTGNDELWGMIGNDVFVFRAGFGQDRIMDFEGGPSVGDQIFLSRSIVTDFSALLKLAADVGNDCVITFDANNSITLAGFKKANLSYDDFRFV